MSTDNTEEPVSNLENIQSNTPKQEPLLKMDTSTSDTVSYRPKIAPSGTIVKPKSSKNDAEISINAENTKSILKVLTGSDVVSGGTITKRK